MARKVGPIELTIAETTEQSRAGWPLTSGVPFAPGQLSASDQLKVSGPKGEELPLQAQPLVTWPDGSVKWALLDLQADTRAGADHKLALSRGKSTAAPQASASASKRDGIVRIRTGALDLSVDLDDFRLITSAKALGPDGRMTEVLGEGSGLTLIDGRKRRYFGHLAPVEATIEQSGPMRVTVAFRGEYRSKSGARCFSFTVRLHAFAGSDLVRVEHMILNDNESGVFTKVRDVSLGLRPAGEITSAEIGGAGKAKGDARLFQTDHTGWVADGASRKKGRRAPGWVTASAGDLSLTATVRDFWQQWPKSLAIDDGELVLGLFPTLADDQYDGLDPVEMYYYLFDGAKYMIKTGVAKRHELWLRLSADGSVADGDALAECANAPLFAVASPEQFTASGAMGDMIPASDPASAVYNKAEGDCFETYVGLVDSEGYYGVLNWGDWFGERTYNWGNEEYDTQHAFFLQLARTGDVKYFRWGETNARHNIDVDVVHAVNDDYLSNWEINQGGVFPVMPGAVYLHAMGHVGGYWPKTMARKRWPKAYPAADPRNLGHLWTEGMVDYYCLTGDPWALEVATSIADYLETIGKCEDMTWWIGKDPHCGRTAGWSLHALMGVYRVTHRRKYATAAKKIVDLILADQDPNCGGWIYQLYPGHCLCRTPHWGMATFITAIMMNGMIKYYEATDDERVLDSVLRGCDFIIADSWDEHVGQFRYTSCPVTPHGFDLGSLRSLSFAARVGGSERHAEVLRRVFGNWADHVASQRGGTAWGKSYGSYNRDLPHVIADMKAIGEG